MCVDYENIQNNSTHVEVRHDALVEKLKEKLCRVMFGQQEEECLEVYGIKKEINDEHGLDAK